MKLRRKYRIAFIALNGSGHEKSFAVLSTKKVKHGKVTFAIKNAGKTTHDFEIDGHKSKTIGPGKTTSLTVMLKAGHYTYKCTIDSHAALGMKGTLDVT